MTMKELYKEIVRARESVFDEIEEIENNGIDYPLEEERYDEGYVNALNWVAGMIEREV